MTKNQSNLHQSANSWDAYWQGTGENGAFTSGGVSHPEIQKFWLDFFNSIKNDFNSPKILDVASGNGAVIEHALSVFQDQASDITSVDISDSAIQNINHRFPHIKGIVSDASVIPLKSETFDIVTSQYGVEYAGHNAILEAARLVANGGLLALILHIESGSIHHHSMQNLAAMEKLEESKFIPLAIKMFDAGFKAVKGADRADYETAASNLAPAISEFEQIMTHYGQNIADNTIVRLYNDVGQIHQQLQSYDADEVIEWLNRMSAELIAYTERMSSMCRSAMSNQKFETVQNELENLGFSIKSAETLMVSDHRKPMAWILIAKKTSV